MGTRRVAFRQCDVARAIRAAKAAGAARVVVRRDGTLAIELTGGNDNLLDDDARAPATKGRDIVL